MHKDLQMFVTTVYEQNIPVPLANAAKEIYAFAKQKGLANEDCSAIFRFFLRRSRLRYLLDEFSGADAGLLTFKQ